MRNHRTTVLRLLLGSSLAIALSGCDSSGGTRVASVGQSARQASASGDASGSAGASGGASASDGSGSSANGSGSTSSNGTGTGGLVGAGGVGGTGLAANTGQPSRGLASPILVTSGNALLDVSDRANTARGPLNEAAPNSAPFTGTVTQVLANTGQALVRDGDGSSYLVDGITAAPGSAVTVSSGQGHLVGGPGMNPLLGVNVVSASNTDGSVATLGAGGNDALLSANVPNNGTLAGAQGAAGSATGNLVTADASGSQVLGNGQASTIGVSALSPTQASGTVLSAGAGSGGNAASLNGTTIASPTTGGLLGNGAIGTGGLGGVPITVGGIGTPTVSSGGATGSTGITAGPVTIGH